MASIECVYQQICDFARIRGAKRVILFGSRARGCSNQKSDIDLAVEGCADFAGFCDDIQERLQSLLTVDIVNLDDRLPLALTEDIRRDGKVLYEAL